MIILIDDDLNLLAIVERAARLAFPEASFKQITTVQEAKGYFTNHDNELPKLILLDVGLPDKEAGNELLMTLRSNERTHMMLVLMLTYNEANSVVKEFYNSTLTHFMWFDCLNDLIC
ncbi:response regulator transcription factor [Spirosoma sp. BT702]|uniref:Response regulator transcription factor n=1 Tax=Spirosoma profusum TaxID=2771354 RepID=A0A926Y0Z0_9BACT|nr:response regulator transcription factor [Spirosoma profusum]